MSKANHLLKRPSIFRRLTGLSTVEFCRLLSEVQWAWDQARIQQANRKTRQRKPGAGHPFALALDDMLLVLLLYYRTYVPYTFLSLLFGVDESTIGRLIRRLEPLLAGIFRIPEKKVEVGEDEIREAFFDATEQPIHRPQKQQKRHYSGKKKRHTIKHPAVVVRKKKRPGPQKQKRRVRIAAVSKAARGKVHDKKVYDRAKVRLPAGVKGYGDSGYQGTNLKTPVKKPRDGTLTRRQRQGNKRLSRKRIVVEHGFGKMKIWRITAEKYRNPLRRHTLMFKNVAGLHNRMFG